MSGIGGEIASGAVHALWAMLAAVPISMWLILVIGILLVVFILRYATNWKVDLTLAIAVFVVCEILAVRQHWIRLGEDEAKAQIKASQMQVDAYKATNQLVIGCYAKDSERLIWIWDRTQGKCIRVDGSN